MTNTNNSRQPKQPKQTTVETVDMQAAMQDALQAVETAGAASRAAALQPEKSKAEPATVEDKLFAEVNSLSTEEFAQLVNRLSIEQLATVQKLFAERCEAEKDKVEKEILTARSEEITPANIAAIRFMLSADDTTPEVLKSLPKSLFNQLFIAAVAALQPEKAAKTEKHNDLTHKFMLSVACYSYLKEANVDNFNSRPVQLLEPLTFADFEKHCQKNTFANNTTFPVTIDGKQYGDKAAAVKAMATLMFNWYTASVKAVA